MTDRKSHRARSVVLVAAALAVATAGALALRPGRAPNPTAAGAAGPPVAGGLVAGDRRRWKLDFETRMNERRAGGAEPLTMNLTAEWVVTVLATRADGYEVACEVASPHVVGAGVAGATGPEVAALERRMAQRFFVSYRGDGAATQIAFPRDVDPGTRNLLQIVVTDTQLVRPAQPATQWTAVERDGAGTYLASYHEAAAGRLVKKKLKYLSVDPSTGATQQPANGKVATGVELVVDASTRTLEVDAAGALVGAEGGDLVRIALPGAMPGGNTGAGGTGGALSMRVSTRLSGLSASRAPEALAGLERERAALEPGPIVTHAPSAEETQARHDRELTAGARLEDLLRGATAPTPDEPTFARLESWLRLHAGDAAPVATALRAATPGAATKAIAEALGRAGTPEAQRALAALAADAAVAVQARVHALVGLMSAEHPTPEALRSVAKLTAAPEAEARQAALLAGGGLAHKLRATAASEADAFDATLLARLTAARKSNDAPARSEIMGAFGNSAGPTLLEALGPVLAEDPDETVRAGAARALRLYDEPAAEALLARTMTTDRAPAVRAAALFARAFVFDEGDIEPLAKAALEDKSEIVRGQATTTLGQHQDGPPDAAARIAATLKAVAEKDPKPGVRKLAREALARAPR